ncbi:hypothetical protein [Mycobacterium sp. AZCC_0083]|uniref:hypothetical protein n=1 Tax=Mycobacterium sp. AZCC_0083 TaxID=2735882 RepID=UPI001617DC29|nr:hypothetical protein [Mycobacterium sp. AZCC_0083]MBB5166961.1 hypothetical protein [Mycobacterium sp. AZCC_0083]
MGTLRASQHEDVSKTGRDPRGRSPVSQTSQTAGVAAFAPREGASTWDRGSGARLAVQLQRTVGNRETQRLLRPTPGAGAPNVQRATVQRAPTKPLVPSVNDIEILGTKLKTRQLNVSVFTRNATQDINALREYFKWVNAVYRRCYDHYDLVIKQAAAEAQTEQAWLDYASGAAIGIAVGLAAEGVIAAAAKAGLAAEKSLEAIGEVAGEFIEGGISANVKFDVPVPKIAPELSPALRQVQTLQKLDDLSAAVLPMATGSQVYTDAIVGTERISADLRVGEAGGKRRMTDSAIQQEHVKLMRFELASFQSDREVDAVAARFDALRTAYNGKQPPSDMRCEQDIWIPWIAQQSGEAIRNVFITPVLSRPVLANHLVDIGLAARGGAGGRLNADISKSRRTKPEEITSTLEPHQQLIVGARAENPALPQVWRAIFLLDK